VEPPTAPCPGLEVGLTDWRIFLLRCSFCRSFAPFARVRFALTCDLFLGCDFPQSPHLAGVIEQLPQAAAFLFITRLFTSCFCAWFGLCTIGRCTSIYFPSLFLWCLDFFARVVPDARNAFPQTLVSLGKPSGPGSGPLTKGFFFCPLWLPERIGRSFERAVLCDLRREHYFLSGSVFLSTYVSKFFSAECLRCCSPDFFYPNR